jgi:hypothetical protein
MNQELLDIIKPQIQAKSQELYEWVKDLSEHIIYPTYENQNEASFNRNVKGLIEDLEANDIEATNDEVIKCIDLLFEEREREEEE